METSSLSEIRNNLNYYGADYPVITLVERLQKGEFIVPNFQRGYVWKSEQASKFIESLLLGIPIPAIFLAKDKFSKHFIIIDGQQRLKTLQSFYEGKFPDGKKFKLHNVVADWENKTYETLSISDRIDLDHTIIHATIINENANSNGIFHIFERLNTTGIQLTDQEIRSGIYYGKLVELLRKLAHSEVWKKLFAYKNNDFNSSRDEELIVSFFALYYDWQNYRGNMKEFLNDFMLKNRNLEVWNESQMSQLFENVISQMQLEWVKSFRNKEFFAVFAALVAQNYQNTNFSIENTYQNLIKNNFGKLNRKKLEEIYQIRSTTA